ncbi:MAG: glycosyltransferase family protein [Chloroflexi bacterium]|nr:glycosyltransferase family protein [Chloroflexota bacterium]
MPEPRTIAIIQARMASSRLPGKVLADLGGQPALAWMTRRAGRAARIDDVVVATTADASDDPVAAWCTAAGVSVYRGSMQDVLDRYLGAARAFNASVIVRLTGDCPFIDPQILDEDLATFFAHRPPLDFAANRLPGDRTVPIGLDTEICTRAALERAAREATEPHQREHAMPYFYENPELFNILHIRHTPDYGHLRWTLDTPEDLAFLRAIVAHFPDDSFSWLDVLTLVQEHPELSAINAAVRHKDYREVDDRQP